MFDDDDVCGGGNTFMDKTVRVELLRPSNNLLLELLSIHATLRQSLNKQGRRGLAASNNDTLKNKFTTCGVDIVLDRPDAANDELLWMIYSG